MCVVGHGDQGCDAGEAVVSRGAGPGWRPWRLGRRAMWCGLVVVVVAVEGRSGRVGECPGRGVRWGQELQRARVSERRSVAGSGRCAGRAVGVRAQIRCFSVAQ